MRRGNVQIDSSRRVPLAIGMLNMLKEGLQDPGDERDEIGRLVLHNPFERYVKLGDRAIETFGKEQFKQDYTDDVKIMFRSVWNNPVTIARSANATGKTHGAGTVAVTLYKIFPDAQVYTAAAPPEENLKKILWGEIGKLVSGFPHLFKDDTVSSLNIERAKKFNSFITGVAIPNQGSEAERKARFSGKHAPHIIFIIDEGDAVPPEIYEAIESCMTGGWARLLIMFNPRHESGPLYIKERDKTAAVVELSAFRHPNVVTGEEKLIGAVSREVTVRRINEWTRPLATGEKISDDSVFEVPDYLVGYVATSQSGVKFPPLNPGKRVVHTPAFSYMVLGKYPAQGEQQLISRMWLDKAHQRWNEYVEIHGERPPNISPILGLDVGEFGKDGSALCANYGGFIPRLKTWGGVDVKETATIAAKDYKDLRASCINVDANGVGAGAWAELNSIPSIDARRVMTASTPEVESTQGKFAYLRDQLAWAVREWLRMDQGAMLPPDPELDEELLAPSYVEERGKIRVTDKKVMRELLGGRSPNKFDALCLAHYTQGKMYGSMVQGNYRRGKPDFVEEY